jgi:hypothetical protein
MTDVKTLPRLLAVLHSLPLWILVGLAAAGYAALFLPAFGGVDLADFRKQWGWLCWLDAVTFTIFSAACAVDLALKSRRARARRRRLHEKNRYYEIYAPLYAELKIHITTSTATLAPFFRQELQERATNSAQ